MSIQPQKLCPFVSVPRSVPTARHAILNSLAHIWAAKLVVADDANHALIMEVRAEDDEKAQSLAGVLERHLVRFGEREELVVEFHAV